MIQDALTESKSVWSTSEPVSGVSHSVLDLTQPSMWSAASARVTPFATTEKNSLSGIISDADDFPVVDMPTSMADLQTDEHSPKRASAGQPDTVEAKDGTVSSSSTGTKSPALVIPDFHRTFMSPTISHSEAGSSSPYSASAFGASHAGYASQQYPSRQPQPVGGSYYSSSSYAQYMPHPAQSAYGAVGASRPMYPAGPSPYASNSRVYAAYPTQSPYGAAGLPYAGYASSAATVGYPSSLASSDLRSVSSGYPSVRSPTSPYAPSHQHQHQQAAAAHWNAQQHHARSTSASSPYYPHSAGRAPSYHHSLHQQQPQQHHQHHQQAGSAARMMSSAYGRPQYSPTRGDAHEW